MIMERSNDSLTPTVQHENCGLLKNWQLNRWGKNNITLEEQKVNLKKKHKKQVVRGRV